MFTGNYPRVYTIVAPEELPADVVGAYVSERAADILTDLGTSNYNPKSVGLRCVSLRVFVLSLEAAGRYVPTQKEKDALATLAHHGEEGLQSEEEVLHAGGFIGNVASTKAPQGIKIRPGKANTIGGR